MYADMKGIYFSRLLGINYEFMQANFVGLVIV